MSFANQVAIITGASTGIGHALARVLAAQRCRVGLIMALFGTSPKLLRPREALRKDGHMDRVVKTLARLGRGPVSTIVEVRGLTARGSRD